MHPSSLSVAIDKLLIRFDDHTATNSNPSARERGDRQRSRDQPAPDAMLRLMGSKDALLNLSGRYFLRFAPEVAV